MNIKLASQILADLIKVGVSDFCVCPGARNSPFVSILADSQGLQVRNFFEERAAAFFALGLSYRVGKPVVVITTSGTAAAELLPAAIEAHYSRIPLILLTADRPSSFRNTGAPQSIEQIGLFSHYVESCFDLEKDVHLNLESWSRKSPVHINVCFEEPLIDAPIQKLDVMAILGEPHRPTANPSRAAEADPIILRKPLILVGGLEPSDRAHIVEVLSGLNAPVYAEAFSGLHAYEGIQKCLLRGSEKTIQKLFDDKICESVLRIGTVPTLRFWRDLEQRYAHIPVFSVSDAPFSGLSRKSQHWQGFSHLQRFRTEDVEARSLIPYKEIDNEFAARLRFAINANPYSELNWVKNLLSNAIRSSLYVGNSLPIRELDLVLPLLSESLDLDVWANRGANGIDGQISSYLGWSSQLPESWCLVGDLTALYDLSSLWIARQLPQGKRRIIIMNNGGGQIFHQMFHRKEFINTHELSFRPWAEMWGWDYAKWTDPAQITRSLADQVIIEVVPSNEQSNQAWAQIKSNTPL